uniref:DUF306 domain-containing protein n=1 Tax=Helicotheca tamesis TaxID=374047 RepID=A0A7S2MEG6_9STRA
MKYFPSQISLLLLGPFIEKCSSSFPDTLEGRCFSSIRVMEGDDERELIPDTHIDLCFEEEGNIRAYTGCNNMGSTCTLDDDDHLDCDFIFTSMMYCGEDFEDQDSFVSSFLESKPLIVLDGNNLGMSSGDTVISFLDKEEADPDRTLMGTEWRVEGFVLPKAYMSISLEFGAWALFGDDSIMSWFDGCNTNKRSFSILNGLINFGPLEGEPLDCDDDTNSRYAGFFNAMFLTEDATYTIDGPSLRIVNSDGYGVSFLASSGGIERRAFNEGYVAAE